MNEAYLIIKTGPEGIDDLCYLTDSSNDAITKIKELRADQQKEKEERMKIDKKSPFGVENVGYYNFIYDPDLYCIQKWDGENFECVCSELGVAPSKLMLR